MQNENTTADMLHFIARSTGLQFQGRHRISKYCNFELLVHADHGMQREMAYMEIRSSHKHILQTSPVVFNIQ